MIAGFTAVLLLAWAVSGFSDAWLRWKQTTAWNPAFLEGLAWSHGQLSLPHRLWDTAYLESAEKVYNVFPPLQSLLGLAAVGLARLSGDDAPFPETRLFPLLVFGLPLPIAGYWVFRRRTRSNLWGVVLTVAWLLGTAVRPCINEARNDGVHHINHLLSQIGLLLLAGELLGRRRLWLTLIGLAIAAWSRQLTIIYAFAVLVAASYPSPERERRVQMPRDTHGNLLLTRLSLAFAGLAVIVAVPAALNWAKVGRPFSGGYELIYVGRDHGLAKDVRAHGLFSPTFLTRNAYYMNAALPIGRAEDGLLAWRPAEYGTSLWIGTPLLALALVGVRTWWREPAARAMMLCTLPVIAALLLYHGTGQRQYGYWRFSLDFAPVWLVAAAPWLASGWRRWVTLPCTAWSVAYFVMVDHWSPVVSG